MFRFELDTTKKTGGVTKNVDTIKNVNSLDTHAITCY